MVLCPRSPRGERDPPALGQLDRCLQVLLSLGNGHTRRVRPFVSHYHQPFLFRGSFCSFHHFRPHAGPHVLDQPRLVDLAIPWGAVKAVKEVGHRFGHGLKKFGELRSRAGCEPLELGGPSLTLDSVGMEACRWADFAIQGNPPGVPW